MNRSPDSIDRWLDVFVRLLRVPTHDAQRIRAELDDHLRARTHDLMVSGHTEPEAVRTAIAELGETAELARNFALARTSPRRRLVMQTAVLAVAGTAIAVGSAALLSSNAVPSSSQDAIAQAPVQPNETTDRGIAEAEPDPALFERDLVAHEGDFATLGDLVALLEETTGEKVIIPAIGVSEHPARYDEDSPLEPVELTGLTIQQGLNIVGRQFAFRPTDALVLNETDTALELAPQSFFDFRDAILIEYDIRDLLYPAQGEFIEPVDFAATVTSLIEPTLWDSATRGIPPRARMGVLSTTLLVNAHPRIHQQIEGLFDRIRSRYAAQEAQSLQTRRQGLIEEITRLEETLVERRARLGFWTDGSTAPAPRAPTASSRCAS